MADAGWYPDPSDPTAQRYWDGAAWTEHKAPGAGYAPPPVTPAATGYAPPPVAQPAYAQPGYGQPAYGQPAHGYAQQWPAIRKFGFGEAIRRGLGQWKNFSGRATMAEYWWFYLFVVLVFIPLEIILFIILGVVLGTSVSVDSATNETTSNVSSGGVAAIVIVAIVFTVVAILLFLPQLAVTVRRLHDTGKSGWWIFISFIPFGGLVLLIFMLMPSTPTDNQYGPPVT